MFQNHGFKTYIDLNAEKKKKKKKNAAQNHEINFFLSQFFLIFLKKDFYKMF